MNNIPIKSVTVVLFKENKVLLIKVGKISGSTDEMYELPGGRLEGEETYEEGVIRELNESSGLETKTEFLVKFPTYYEAELERKDGLSKFCAWSYLCTKYWGDIKPNDEKEPVWIKINDLKNIHLQINVDKMIAEALIESQKQI